MHHHEGQVHWYLLSPLSKDHYVGKSRGFGFIVMKGLVAVEAILANRDEHFLAGKKVLIFNFAFLNK
jgi:hypothetical protein